MHHKLRMVCYIKESKLKSESDIFSLGVWIFTMMTGLAPFRVASKFDPWF